jgi:hypothetical protein
MNSTNLTLKDFQLCNAWVVDENGERCHGDPKYIIDQTTGHRYRNEEGWILRVDMLSYLSCYAVYDAFGALGCAAFRTLKVLSCSHFWPCIEQKYEPLNKDVPRYTIEEAVEPVEEEELLNRNTLCSRVNAAGIDVLKVVGAPLIWLGGRLAACYGLVRPYDGRKLYVSFGRLQYGDALPWWYRHVSSDAVEVCDL